MASTYTGATEPEKVAAEPHVEKAAPLPPPPGIRASGQRDRFALADVLLRFLLFASAVVAVVVMVTSKETKLVRVPIPPSFPMIFRTAKFNQSPAFIYFVAALSVAGLYGLITTLLSFYSLLKPGSYPKLISHFVIFDVILLGIVAAAVGSAGAVAYIGLKGNSHVQWNKVCNMFDDFCKHIGASLAVSLFGSFVLVLLVLLSISSLSKKIPKHNHSQ